MPLVVLIFAAMALVLANIGDAEAQSLRRCKHVKIDTVFVCRPFGVRRAFPQYDYSKGLLGETTDSVLLPPLQGVLNPDSPGPDFPLETKATQRGIRFAPLMALEPLPK